MNEYFAAILTAFWLGILTSISPCPLATNIAAISYVGRRVGEPGKTFQAGLLYTLGRTAAYMAIGIVLVSSLLSAPVLSHLLQKYMNKFLGPILILVGLVLLNVVSFSFSGGGVSENLQSRVDRMGIWGGAFLGFLFALSFCPTSAALFFGSLLPLAVQQHSSIVLPAVYGVATGLPVFLFALLIALGANRVGTAFNLITHFETWARRITGLIFILVGIYYTLINIFGIMI
ncbi:MAG: aromatic aminobenezylarsenical efflux permease ArsG family transporter [Pseudomonadota bacterium]|nr:aromatic aminobenezylarsenical efflux permease ArsG family transporter [Pseudomonadota bacterium]